MGLSCLMRENHFENLGLMRKVILVLCFAGYEQLFLKKIEEQTILL